MSCLQNRVRGVCEIRNKMPTQSKLVDIDVDIVMNIDLDDDDVVGVDVDHFIVKVDVKLISIFGVDLMMRLKMRFRQDLWLKFLQDIKIYVRFEKEKNILHVQGVPKKRH